jgi:hypothetical protein
MAKRNSGELVQQINYLSWQLECAQVHIKFQELLRRIENLTENNFEGFIDDEVTHLVLRDDGFYLPVATGLTKDTVGIGKYARQC